MERESQLTEEEKIYFMQEAIKEFRLVRSLSIKEKLLVAAIIYESTVRMRQVMRKCLLFARPVVIWAAGDWKSVSYLLRWSLVQCAAAG